MLCHACQAWHLGRAQDMMAFMMSRTGSTTLVATCLGGSCEMPFRGAFTPDVISVASGLSEGFYFISKEIL